MRWSQPGAQGAGFTIVLNAARDQLIKAADLITKATRGGIVGVP
ncbi:MAG TPA: hypothetical protein PKE46_13190 [Micropruina sp.]|nr:hypothetical protein [Micropruina sp.]HMR23085.1 hypothetical protein [Micropruina sp.]